MAGRAGRLGRELHGNIFFVHLDEDEPEGIYRSEKNSVVEFSYDATIKKGVGGISGALGVGLERDSSADAAAAKLFYDKVILDQDIGYTLGRLGMNSQDIETVVRQVESIEGQVPKEIWARRYSVAPVDTMRIFQELSTVDNIDKYIPVHPLSNDAWDRTLAMVRLIRRCCLGTDDVKDEKARRYFTVMILKWIQELPLRTMIEETRDRSASGTVADALRKVIKTIEEDIRFFYVRMSEVFLDVLAYKLRLDGRDHDADTLKPVTSYLELGAYTPLAMALLKLGVSRPTAISVSQAFHGIRFSGDAAELVKVLDESIHRTDVPRLCQAELIELLDQLRD